MKLDHKEGAPDFYKKIDITIQTTDGFQKAFTYKVVSPQGDFVPPSEEYAQIFSKGLKAHDLDNTHIQLAFVEKDKTTETQVFIFCTLRTGECLAGSLGDL